MGIWLYVLALEDDCFYVGQAQDPEKRIRAHFAGKGASWTRLHKPLAVLLREDTGETDPKVAEKAENNQVLHLMRKHGWERVRGGFWSHTCPIQTRKNLEHHGVFPG